jgi:hypothetical protein
VKLTESRSRDHLGVNRWGQNRESRRKKENFILKFIKGLTLDSTSFHNLHLYFKAWNIYSTLSLNSSFNIDPFNKGLTISITHENRNITLTINPTDTVTVAIACSSNPFPLNLVGHTTLCNALSIISYKLSEWVKDSVSLPSLPLPMPIPVPVPSTAASSLSSSTMPTSIPTYSSLSPSPTATLIPHYKTWIVTLWHLNADSKVKYTGEAFSIDIEGVHNVLGRIYTKKKKNGRYPRIELQECPNKSIVDLMEYRLNHNLIS